MSNKSDDIDLSPYMEALSRRFRPATSPAEATHRLSTREVKYAIEELNPGLTVPESLVFDAMAMAGYEFEAVRGFQSLKFK